MAKAIISGIKPFLLPVLQKVSQARIRLLEIFWCWLELFPGNLAILTPVIAAVAILLIQNLLWVILFANYSEETATSIFAVIPFLLLFAALALFPEETTLGKRVLVLAIFFGIGGAPLAFAYITLANFATSDNFACLRAWKIASQITNRTYLLVLRLSNWRPPALTKADSLPRAWEFLLLGALICGAVYALGYMTTARQSLISADAIEYDTMARQIASGKPLQLDHSVVLPSDPQITTYANRTPGYPFFLMLVYRLLPGTFIAQWQAVVYLQIALYLLTGLLIFAALRRILPNFAAFSGLVLWFSYNLAVEQTHKLLPETLASFLVALIFFITLQRNHWLAWIAAGGLIALAALTRPELLGLAAVFLVAALTLPKLCPLLRLRNAALLLIFCALALSPWVIRNQRVLNKFVLISTAGGFNFWSGNYLPFQGVVRDRTYQLEHKILERRKIDKSDEVAVDQALLREGITNVVHYLRSRPGDYLLLLGQKLKDSWEMPFLPSVPEQFTRLVLKLVVFFFCLGSAVILLHWRRLIIMLTIPAYLTFIHLASYGHENRYMLPATPLVFAIVAVGVWIVFAPQLSDNGTQEQH